ncbi:MAG: HAMP domain-containing sensor histidine kinase [Terrimesophilobacter sp.]
MTLLSLSRLSIRWRITLGSLLVAALFFGVAATLFRLQVDSILTTATVSLATNDASQFTSDLIRSGGSSVSSPSKGQLAAAVDPAGTVEFSTLPAGVRKRLPALLSAKNAEQITSFDDKYVVVSKSVPTAAGRWEVVTARNRDAPDLILDRLTQALVIASVVLVVGFGGASWLLTGAALRPVTRMRKRAELLSAEGSAQPLPVGATRDELAALATTLNEFIQRVRQSAARERQMVSDASHELRTPIAILKTQLELAHLAHGDAAALEGEISAAERSVERLAGLATGLLELSRLESSPTGASSSGTELAAELALSVDRARVLAAPHDITVDFDSDDLDDATRYAVARDNFGRLISNLTGNAIASLPTGGSVDVDLRQSGSSLFLTITDSGAGMPEEFLPIAFDRFSRPDGARGGTGSGLGLAIVRAITVAAHGTVRLENRPSGGFRVSVMLPALPPDLPQPV